MTDLTEAAREQSADELLELLSQFEDKPTHVLDYWLVNQAGVDPGEVAEARGVKRRSVMYNVGEVRRGLEE